MGKNRQKIEIPRIIHTCCGINYDNFNPDTLTCFNCFMHKPENKTTKDFSGNEFEINFCITIWLICKNNNCITNFTFFYDYQNKIRQKIKIKGIKYLLKIKDKFLKKLTIKLPEIPQFSKSKKYLWRYTDYNHKKKNVSNIYTLDDKKIGETEEQKVTIYKS